MPRSTFPLNPFLNPSAWFGIFQLLVQVYKTGAEKVVRYIPLFWGTDGGRFKTEDVWIETRAGGEGAEERVRFGISKGEENFLN